MNEISYQQPIKVNKILYIITKSDYGGAGKYVLDLAKNSLKEGFDVTVACGGNGLLIEKLREANIRTVNVEGLERDINIFKEFKVLGILRKLIKQEGPNVLHLNSSKIGGIGAFAGRLEGVENIIYTAHGWAFNEDRGLIWRTLTYIASVATAVLCDTIITISRKEQNQAIKFPFVGVSKVRMIYNGISQSLFKDKNEARLIIENTAGIKIPDGVPVLGTIGELHKNKGYIYALGMCKLLKERERDFIYFIIGEGEERITLQKYIRENKLENNVFLLGAIPDKTSGATLLRAFDIFLLPSTKEGLPYVLLEAGLAKVACVSTNVGGIPEMIEHGKSGLLCAPSNEGTLTIQVEKLLFDERVRQDMALNHNANTLEKFSLKRMLQETLIEYQIEA